MRSASLKPQSGGRVELGAASAPGLNATNADKKPQRGDRVKSVSVSPLRNREWHGINGINWHERGASVAPSGLFVGFDLAKPGAEAAPGSTRSPLCGLCTVASEGR